MRLKVTQLLLIPKKSHEGLKALAKVVILLWWCKCQKYFRAVHKVDAYYCHSCDYRIRKVEHLKEHNGSLMMPEILAIVVVTIQQDRMAWITMSKAKPTQIYRYRVANDLGD